MSNVQNCDKHVLLTGASGALGQMLTPLLAGLGYKLRLSDINDYPETIPAGAEFIRADLADRAQVRLIMRDIDCVVHLGGIGTELDFDGILKANIIGCSNMFETAQEQKARVIFASSNHAIGFYPRGETVTTAMPFKPDGYYGLSKAYGELLGKMFFDKHGTESVHLRIGSCLVLPTEERHLSTWLSHEDMLHLVQAAIEAPVTGYAIIWGVSNNHRSWWVSDDRELIGYQPQSNAEDYADKIEHIHSDNEITEKFQGGSFCAVNYSRSIDAQQPHKKEL